MNIVTEAPIPRMSTPNVVKENISSGSDMWYYIKIFGMLLIIILLGINVYLYATEGTTLIKFSVESCYRILNSMNIEN